MNFFRIDDEMYFADLPGYGYARVPVAVRAGWEELVTSYLLDRPALALCVFLVDARHRPMANDEALHAFLEEHSLPWLLVATKADKLGRGALRQRENELSAGLGKRARAVLGVSALRRTGVPALWGEIRRATSGHREETHGS